MKIKEKLINKLKKDRRGGRPPKYRTGVASATPMALGGGSATHKGQNHFLKKNF